MGKCPINASFHQKIIYVWSFSIGMVDCRRVFATDFEFALIVAGSLLCQVKGHQSALQKSNSNSDSDRRISERSPPDPFLFRWYLPPPLILLQAAYIQDGRAVFGEDLVGLFARGSFSFTAQKDQIVPNCKASQTSTVSKNNVPYCRFLHSFFLKLVRTFEVQGFIRTKLAMVSLGLVGPWMLTWWWMDLLMNIRQP